MPILTVTIEGNGNTAVAVARRHTPRADNNDPIAGFFNGFTEKESQPVGALFQVC